MCSSDLGCSVSIEIITSKQEESARLRELRLRALADAPYAFGADY